VPGWRVAAVRAGGQPLQNGQGEAGGLAGAGLGGAQQVFPGENNGDGLRLDGGGLGIALVRYGAEQLRPEAERIERRTDGNLLRSACEGLTFDRFRQMLFRLVIERSRMDR
jgi:hypothetical protein